LNACDSLHLAFSTKMPQVPAKVKLGQHPVLLEAAMADGDPRSFDERNLRLVGGAQWADAQAQNNFLSDARHEAFSSHTALKTEPLGFVTGTTTFGDGRGAQSALTQTAQVNEPGVGHITTKAANDKMQSLGSVQTDATAVFSADKAETQVTSTLRDANGRVIQTTDYNCPVGQTDCSVKIKNGDGQLVATGTSKDTPVDDNTNLHVLNLWDAQGKPLGTMSEKIHVDPGKRDATVDVKIER
jgi:hypothetical protein